MIKYIIFDLDGTLVDTITDLMRSVNFALEKMGYPRRDIAEIKSFVGNGIAKLVERSLPDNARSSDIIQKTLSHFTNHYDLHCKDTSVPYPGIYELLEELVKRKIILSVASNKYQKATSLIISSLFPDISFASVMGHREGTARKPEPEIIYNIMDEIISDGTIKKEEVMLIGDSSTDILTARNASIAVCAVTWGFRPIEELKKFKPDYLAEEPLDILKYLS